MKGLPGDFQIGFELLQVLFLFERQLLLLAQTPALAPQRSDAIRDLVIAPLNLGLCGRERRA